MESSNHQSLTRHAPSESFMLTIPGPDQKPLDDVTKPVFEQGVGVVEIVDLGLAPAQASHDISGLSIIALGFNICNSWVGMACSLAIGITLGGTVTVLYGTLLCTILYLATGATLAELSSVSENHFAQIIHCEINLLTLRSYPTAGGQYHFTSLLAPARFSRSLSYACGLLSAFSWVALAAAITILDAQIIVAVAALWHEGYVAKEWHIFVISQSFSLMLLLTNLFVTKRAPWMHEIGCK